MPRDENHIILNHMATKVVLCSTKSKTVLDRRMIMAELNVNLML
jgi:hypothetical protein